MREFAHQAAEKKKVNGMIHSMLRVTGSAVLLFTFLTACTPGGSGMQGNDNDNDGGMGTVEFDICESDDADDADIDFGEPGELRMVASSLGLGRHVVYTTDTLLTLEFDGPIRSCSVVAENITLRDLTADADVVLQDENLERQHLVDDNGMVVASRIVITLPNDLIAGNDFELTLDSETIGLDGEFQETVGTARTNGTLPTGDGNPGGDLIQVFRLVTLSEFLSNTSGASGLALDQLDRLFLLSGEAGVFGPFVSAGEVTAGSMIGGDLGTLAQRTIAVDPEGRVVVKDGNTNNQVFAIDPDSGEATLIAEADTSSFPDDLFVAPDGFFSAERAGVEAGDLIFSNVGSILVQDLRGAVGNKGGINLVDRAGIISDAYVNLFEPDPGSGMLYAGYKPEENTGFEIHRILPNGTVDRSVLTNPSSIEGVAGTAVAKLADIDGRQEYLIVGTIDTGSVSLPQLLPSSFDGRCLMIYEETRSRLSVLTPLAIDEFNFASFGQFSDLALDSSRDNAFVSLPSLDTVWQLHGLSNSDSSVSPDCDSSIDDNLTGSLADGSARVVRSTIGNGRFVIAGDPTVLMFDFDQIIPICSADTIHMSLRDETNDVDMNLTDARVRRLLLDDAGEGGPRSRLVVDLPAGLDAGSTYSLTLNAGAMGLDGEFGTGGENGSLPSGDGAAGGDFVQYFQVLAADYFLTETGGAVGVDVDGSNQLFAATDTQIFGPFTTPTTPGGALRTITVGTDQEIAGSTETAAGKPMVANDSDARAEITYSSLRNSRLYDADRTTGIEEIFQTQAGQSGPGTFEIDLIETPNGYFGDYLLINLQRGVTIDTATMETQVLFESTSQLLQFKSINVPPADLFQTTVLLATSDASTATASGFNVAADGTSTVAFALQGATCEAAMRLRDNDGRAEFLLLGDYAGETAGVSTGQIRDASTGSELIWFRPSDEAVQVIGSFSAGTDMTFDSDLNTVYMAHPVLRAVLRIQGLD